MTGIVFLLFFSLIESYQAIYLTIKLTINSVL
ncbi:hypothetical protein YPPY58_2775, partial [Yersinia pestis PY-58]